jgi:hypothetical protein
MLLGQAEFFQRLAETLIDLTSTQVGTKPQVRTGMGDSEPTGRLY